MKNAWCMTGGIFLVLTYGCCRDRGPRQIGIMYDQSGVVDIDESSDGKDFYLLAGYAGSAKVIVVKVETNPSHGADTVAERIETAWNDLPIDPIGHCEPHRSMLIFPMKVDDIRIINEDGVVQRLATTSLTLSNGIKMKRVSGCSTQIPEP